MPHRYVTADSTLFTADALYWTADGDYQHDSVQESGALGVVAITRIAFDPSGPQSYNEASAVSYQVTFYDSGVETIPTTIRYRIDDDKSGDEILGWTSVTTTGTTLTESDAMLIPGAGMAYISEVEGFSGATITIDIPGTLNVMIDEANRRERKTLTVEADAGGAFAFSASAHYDIINRLGI